MSAIRRNSLGDPVILDACGHEVLDFVQLRKELLADAYREQGLTVPAEDGNRFTKLFKKLFNR